MPEPDLEMTAMLSRAAERVGLEWRKPLCPEPSRLDDWFLGVDYAGSQCLATGASRTCMRAYRSWMAPLLPETDLLTPPPSPPLVVQLGVYGFPPVERSVAMQVCPYTVSTRQGKPCLLFSGPVGTRLVSSGEAYVACGDAAPPNTTALLQVLQAKSTEDMHGGGHDPEVLKELRTASDLPPRATKVMARSLGRAMSTLVVQERHL